VLRFGLKSSQLNKQKRQKNGAKEQIPEPWEFVFAAEANPARVGIPLLNPLQSLSVMLFGPKMIFRCFRSHHLNSFSFPF
jgi:hypothetical protein